MDWPVGNGAMITPFRKEGSLPHDGIDIKAPIGTPVKVVEDGVVLYSGNQIKGYGHLVIVRHDGGLITVYAHNRRNLVKEGAPVIRGDAIAELGDSGSVTVPHLHFEMRKGEQPVDPMPYLSPKKR